jgi:hypothetical protein
MTAAPSGAGRHQARRDALLHNMQKLLILQFYRTPNTWHELWCTSGMRIAIWTALIAGLAYPALADANSRAADGHPYLISKSLPNNDGVIFARQEVPAVPQVAGLDSISALAESRIVYLNRSGITVAPGNNDSRANVSSLAKASTQLKAWDVSDTDWNSTVSCIQDLFARFQIQIVTTDPGNVSHVEAVFSSDNFSKLNPTDPNALQVAGISPFTNDCGVINNSMVFTFAGALNNKPRTVCEVMAQEIAHSYGADHELLASDPLTYLPYNGDRSFKNEFAACGESNERPCGINGSTCRDKQNSVQLLGERLGFNNGSGQPGATEDDNAEIRGGCAATNQSIQFGALLFALSFIRKRQRTR